MKWWYLAGVALVVAEVANDAGVMETSWLWIAAIGLALSVGVVELLRRRAREREGHGYSTRNAMRGVVRGAVVQAGKIDGPVTLIAHSSVPSEDSLSEVVDILAQAVGARWRREEEQRQVQDPFPLPVRWHLAPETLTDHWANIGRAPAGVDVEPLHLTGFLDEVVDVYRRIPSGRLVVLGRAGSGKTILALRFVLDLLDARVGSDPVPVIFSIGGWNPTTTSLRDWLIDRLKRDYPGLVSVGPDGSELAATLVESGRILPVLDGFDEVAAGLHRAALRALNATVLPLLITSRRDEYVEAVAGADVLTSAAAIELADLDLVDLANYLPRTTRKVAPSGVGGSTIWDPVLAKLRDNPRDSASINLAAVLRTPLMVTLARTIYSDTVENDPMTLLDVESFDSPEAIEGHLLDMFVPTVYDYQIHVRLSQSSGSRSMRWQPERAEHWLGYLAHCLERLGTRDLAWWQLRDTFSRFMRLFVFALVSVAVIMAGILGGIILGFRFEPSVVTAVIVSGVLAVELLGAFPAVGPEPSSLRLKILGTSRKTRPQFVFGLLSGVISGILFGVMIWIGFGPNNGLIGGSTFGFAVWFVTGLVMPLDIKTAVSPVDLLEINRTSTVFVLLVIGLVSGIAGGLVVGLMIGLGFGLLTPWGQWLAFSRFWSPLMGRLPWSSIAFLENAYKRGVLRRSGAVYQFRHARLQGRLAAAYRERRRRSLADRCRLNG
ncbi:NACHT domain-containing protein [Kutzneria sp. NPDC052558]|uniref:NACHT domain-containing protein n=1 Tax=Kutzneria sp. NPDC052558 TaxID=3364121 RepID=UPI0037C5B72F